MPSKKQYNLVNDDAYDTRIPLYNEDAFQHGITFHAKYIGTLDVPRPSSRVEIVAAMRRIRYEFKAKSMKKKKVSITISVDGVKVVLRKKKKDHWSWDDNKFLIMHHPIYRIFYVSHDSQDLKIFSYIARDGGNNSFKCNVFKSNKKSQAMRIVRTVGQAFEVCHKLSLALASSTATTIPAISEETPTSDQCQLGQNQGDHASEPSSCDTQTENVITSSLEQNRSLQPPSTEVSSKVSLELGVSYMSTSGNSLPTQSVTPQPEEAPLGVLHHIQMLKEQLEQQNQQTQTVSAQVQLLKDQLSAETTARLEAQAQNHHLLVHNRELLGHIRNLVKHIQELERKVYIQEGKTDSRPLLPDLSPGPQISPVPDLQFSVATPLQQMFRFDLHQMSDSNTATATTTSSSRSFTEGISITTPQVQVSDSLFQKSNLDSYSNHHTASSTSVPSSSGSPRLSVSAQDQSNSCVSGLSLPNSPTQTNFPAPYDQLLKPLISSNNSPQVRTRSSAVPTQSADELFNSLLGLQNKSESISPGPLTPTASLTTQLNPPPQKIRNVRTQLSDPTPSTQQMNKILHSENLSSSLFQNEVHKDDSAWSSPTPSPIMSRQPSGTRANIFRQYSVPIHLQHEQQQSNQDSFIAQVARDLARMSARDKEETDFHPRESQSNVNFHSLYRS